MTIIDLPLFPLHTVLCPGVALPLHVFEERYRRLVSRCLERQEPFGVVLIRAGREVGASPASIAEVGTTALIREVGRYPDGRVDLMTVGGERFRIRELKHDVEPFIVADVELLEERLGDPDAATVLAERASDRFLRYLELLQPALADDDGPEIEVDVIVDAGEAVRPEDPGEHLVEGRAGEVEVAAGTDADRLELLMAAARRLVTPSDPTALSYVLAGLIQVEPPARQALLEAEDTETRLARLDELLDLEIALLRQGLKPLVVAGGDADRRRN